MVWALSLGAVFGHPKHKKNGHFRAAFEASGGAGKRVS
jgi:hypothetical protein